MPFTDELLQSKSKVWWRQDYCTNCQELGRGVLSAERGRPRVSVCHPWEQRAEPSVQKASGHLSAPKAPLQTHEAPPSRDSSTELSKVCRGKLRRKGSREASG